MSRSLAPILHDTLIDELGQETKEASKILAQVDTALINKVLADIAEGLRSHKKDILEANRNDVMEAKTRRLSDALIDRLTLNDGRIEAMAGGIEEIIKLDDPVGKILSTTKRPNGLQIDKVCVPIGVLGMIYESRPNVTIDASGLCLKSHNAVILRGGSESLNSSLELHEIIQDALNENDLPEACVSMIPVADRSAVGALLQANEYIDVMIPRGGHGLIERVMREARMPVFAHLDGICHTYIHHSAKPEIAREVTVNAKMRRTGVCGATETLLLDSKLDTNIAKSVLKALLDTGCDLVGDDLTCALVPGMTHATENDWSTEYLDAKLSVRMVQSVGEAISHINTYGSHHTDSILAEDKEAVDEFLRKVDSAIVMHNTSTQFADGGEFGMGAEIGIGTGKLHARGPVGVQQLTTYKYVVHGSGQTRP